MLYIGIDPGKTTGYGLVASRNDRIFTLDFRNIPWGHFFDWLQCWPDIHEKYGSTAEPVIVVCENYIQRGTADEGQGSGEWISQETAKQIGAIWFRTNQLSWRYVEQEPSVKPTGYKFSKLEKKDHWADAVSHAFYAAFTGIPKNQGVIWDKPVKPKSSSVQRSGARYTGRTR